MLTNADTIMVKRRRTAIRKRRSIDDLVAGIIPKHYRKLHAMDKLDGAAGREAKMSNEQA